jgi:hypothetical protein
VCDAARTVEERSRGLVLQRARANDRGPVTANPSSTCATDPRLVAPGP